MLITSQSVSHQARVEFPWIWCLLCLASFIYRAVLSQEDSVCSPKYMSYLQTVFLIRVFEWAVCNYLTNTQEEMFSFEQECELNCDYLFMCPSWKSLFLFPLKGFFKFYFLVACFCAHLRKQKQKKKLPQEVQITWSFSSAWVSHEGESDFSEERCSLHFLLNLSATRLIHLVLKISWPFTRHQRCISIVWSAFQ